ETDRFLTTKSHVLPRPTTYFPCWARLDGASMTVGSVLINRRFMLVPLQSTCSGLQFDLFRSLRQVGWGGMISMTTALSSIPMALAQAIGMFYFRNTSSRKRACWAARNNKWAENNVIVQHMWA